MAGTIADRILVVDDNQHTAHLLREVLGAEGHRVSYASDGLEALLAIHQDPPDLVLLDLELPGVTGYEVCKRLKANPVTRWIPIIILTGQISSDVKLQTWELGADEFLTKPFQCAEVVARCRSLLRVKHLVCQLDSAEAVVFAFARAVEAKSPFTHGHSERVRDYALLLAADVGVPRDEWENLGKGALLHDIGKISVPDAILNKPGKLTAEEYQTVKLHTVQGAHIVEPLRSVRNVIPFIRSHHERLDGTGYPDGLTGDQIPYCVKILSVADIYDSLASKRPYRNAIPHEHCLEILQEEAARKVLDQDLVHAFCELVKPSDVCPQGLVHPILAAERPAGGEVA